MEAKGLEPSNLLTASQALYQLSYAPEDASTLSDLADAGLPAGRRFHECRLGVVRVRLCPGASGHLSFACPCTQLLREVHAGQLTCSRGGIRLSRG